MTPTIREGEERFLHGQMAVEKIRFCDLIVQRNVFWQLGRSQAPHFCSTMEAGDWELRERLSQQDRQCEWMEDESIAKKGDRCGGLRAGGFGVFIVMVVPFSLSIMEMMGGRKKRAICH